MLELVLMSYRIVFMGSPDFALPALRALASAYSVVGVVTQPDREAGRGAGAAFFAAMGTASSTDPAAHLYASLRCKRRQLR